MQDDRPRMRQHVCVSSRASAAEEKRLPKDSARRVCIFSAMHTSSVTFFAHAHLTCGRLKRWQRRRVHVFLYACTRAKGPADYLLKECAQRQRSRGSVAVTLPYSQMAPSGQLQQHLPPLQHPGWRSGMRAAVGTGIGSSRAWVNKVRAATSRESAQEGRQLIPVDPAVRAGASCPQEVLSLFGQNRRNKKGLI